MKVSDLKKLPKGLQEVYVVCDRCIHHLIKNGVNPVEAEGSVLEILKENVDLLEKGRYVSVKNNLINIFLNH